MPMGYMRTLNSMPNIFSLFKHPEALHPFLIGGENL